MTAVEHSRGALEVSNATRSWLLCGAAVAGVSIGLILWLSRRIGGIPDLLLGVLAVGALLFLSVAMIGRLPVGFELAGMSIEFRRSDLADLIATVRSTLEDDPNAKEAVLRGLKEAVGESVFREADAKFSESVSRVESAEGSCTVEPAALKLNADSPSTGGGEVKLWIESLPGRSSGLIEKYDVPSSGKGKSPRFDYSFEFEGRRIVLEYERYWNPTTVDLISRKADRALRKETPVDKVVLVAPNDGVSAFREQLADQESVLVVSLDEIRNGDALRRLQDELNVQGRPELRHK